VLQQSFEYPNDVSKTETKPLHDHIIQKSSNEPHWFGPSLGPLFEIASFAWITVVSHSRHRHQQLPLILIDQEHGVAPGNCTGALIFSATGIADLVWYG
jgi:hypothetical protein